MCKKTVKQFLIFILVSFFLFSCSNSTNPSNKIELEMSGVVEKGPFQIGSVIVVQELNENLSPNGISYNITTTDNFGSFNLESEVRTDYVEIIATGYYFNEVLGHVSNTTISLRTIVPANYERTNVNILTTLATKRIMYLMKNENMSYEDAKISAEREILNIFGMDSNDSNFNYLDIASSEILILVSSNILVDNNSSTISSIISTISEDIKEDGTLNNDEIKNEIYENYFKLDSSLIKENIIDYYSSNGVNIDVPDLENVILSIVEEMYIVEDLQELLELSSDSSICSFNNEIFLLHNENQKVYKNNLQQWDSGTTLNLHSQNALLCEQPFDGKLWIQDGFRNLWYSEDGENWIQTDITFAEEEDYISDFIVLNNSLVILSMNGIFKLDNGNWEYVSTAFYNAYGLHNTEIKVFENQLYIKSGSSIVRTENLIHFTEIGAEFVYSGSFMVIDENLFFITYNKSFVLQDNEFIQYHEINSKIYNYGSSLLTEIQDYVFGINYLGKTFRLKQVTNE
jgi:hypothetical protein